LAPSNNFTVSTPDTGDGDELTAAVNSNVETFAGNVLD
jgi:hypothetical protein